MTHIKWLLYVYFGKHRAFYRRLRELKRDVVRQAKKTKPYTYGFCLSLEHAQVRYMRYFFESPLVVSCGAYDTTKRTLRLMDSLLDLYERLSDINFDISEIHINTKNTHRYGKILPENESNDFAKGILLRELYREKTFAVYNRLRTQYFQRCWD